MADLKAKDGSAKNKKKSNEGNRLNPVIRKTSRQYIITSVIWYVREVFYGKRKTYTDFDLLYRTLSGRDLCQLEAGYISGTKGSVPDFFSVRICKDNGSEERVSVLSVENQADSIDPVACVKRFKIQKTGGNDLAGWKQLSSGLAVCDGGTAKRNCRNRDLSDRRIPSMVLLCPGYPASGLDGLQIPGSSLEQNQRICVAHDVCNRYPDGSVCESGLHENLPEFFVEPGKGEQADKQLTG